MHRCTVGALECSRPANVRGGDASSAPPHQSGEGAVGLEEAQPRLRARVRFITGCPHDVDEVLAAVGPPEIDEPSAELRVGGSRVALERLGFEAAVGDGGVYPSLGGGPASGWVLRQVPGPAVWQVAATGGPLEFVCGKVQRLRSGFLDRRRRPLAPRRRSTNDRPTATA